MKNRYKIIIVSLMVLFVYWPGIPLLSLGCQQVTSDMICFDVASLRIPNPFPSEGIWNTGDLK